MRPSKNDPLLAALFLGDPARRSRAIEDIIARHASPNVVEALAKQVARGHLQPTDVADVSNEISLRLIRKLSDLVSDTAADPILSFDDYVGATIHNAMDKYRRRRDPIRSRLADRVRYVLTHTRGLAIFGRDPVLCGFEQWRHSPEVAAVAPPGPLVAKIADDAKELRRTVTAMLWTARGPVELFVLVDTLATALGFTREPFVPLETLREKAVSTNPLHRLEGRQYLIRLWDEITALPVRQRRALLLQLRLEDGESVTRLLVALGIIDLAALPAVLAIPRPELIRIWNELPLADYDIAAMLSVTRQQVINLRKSARERLARRMGRQL